MDNLLQDVRHAVRSLAARPGFTVAVVLTLALGIGATTAIFSVVRGVLLQPLPYDSADRIAHVWNPWTNEPGVARGRSPLSSLDVADMRGAVGSFEWIAAYAPPAGANLTGADRPERVQVMRASADFFAVLGVRPLIGRVFTAEEDGPGSNDVVVLSHELWQRRFGGEAGVLDSVVQLDGVAHRVVGVMPPSFRAPADYASESPTELWKPLGLDASNLDRSNQWLRALARLGPGAPLAVANAELEALTQHWIEQGFKMSELPPYYAVSIEDEIFGGVRRALLVLLAAVGFVLLIACINVANLLLARSDERRPEMALRAALGAGRSRIIAQLLTESAVLALVGGAAGVLLAWAGVQLLIALEPSAAPRIAQVGIDAASLGFTLFTAIATSILFGLVPALQASRPHLTMQLRTGARTMSGGRGGQRFQGTLASGEVAFSVVLLIGASLMIRTFVELSRVDLGFDPAGVLAFDVNLPAVDYDSPEERVRFHMLLARRLGELPGVRAAGAAQTLPLTGRLGGGSLEVEGGPPPRPGEGLPNARWQVATPGYFEVLRYERAEGRLLEETDRADGVPVVVVNRTMAEMFWPGRSPLGRRVRNTNSDVPWFTVVGVVEDVRHSGVANPPSPTLYFPLEQLPLTRSVTPSTMSFVLRTDVAPHSLLEPARDAVRSLDANLPLADVRTMDATVARALARSRFTTALLAIFAAVAFGLAILGIYGVLSYIVARQWREIGIRIALGAPLASVLALIVWKGMRFSVAGLGLGVVAALVLSRLMESLLYGVRSADPVTFLAVPMLFVLVSLAATLVPARRATAIDPMVALRHE